MIQISTFACNSLNFAQFRRKNFFGWFRFFNWFFYRFWFIYRFFNNRLFSNGFFHYWSRCRLARCQYHTGNDNHTYQQHKGISFHSILLLNKFGSNEMILCVDQIPEITNNGFYWLNLASSLNFKFHQHNFVL